MSKKSKQPTKKEKRRATRRQERRFVPQAATSGTVVRAVGALAALLLGAGAWAFFYAQSFASDEKLRSLPSYLIAGGAVLMGIATWFGTSSEPPVRVGAPGIAVEKGELRRMPWWGVEKISFDAGAVALIVTGKDEAGADWTFKVLLKAHAEAVGWIVKEASERIPKRLDISDEITDRLPAASAHAGTLVDLEPLQVVGKKDAITGKTVSYEPDACVCARCERVYVKRSVPKKCKCGNSLVHLRPKDAEDTDGIDDEDEIDDEGGDETDDDDDGAVSSRKSPAAEETADS